MIEALSSNKAVLLSSMTQTGSQISEDFTEQSTYISDTIAEVLQDRMDVIVDLDNWESYRTAINTVRSRRNDWVMGVLKNFVSNREKLDDLYWEKVESITTILMNKIRSEPKKIALCLKGLTDTADNVFFKESAGEILEEIAKVDQSDVDDNELGGEIQDVFVTFEELSPVNMGGLNFEQLDFGNCEFYPFLVRDGANFTFGADLDFEVNFILFSPIFIHFKF